MPSKKFQFLFIALVVAVFAASSAWGAARYHVLHAFVGSDGSYPYSGLISDKAGNLYGATLTGGAHARGTVFKLTPGSNGRWTETILHSFTQAEGDLPYGPLTFDSAGNLYGVTTFGGAHFGGTVFELTPRSNGKWSLAVLYNFDGTSQYLPTGALVFDTKGNLYGVTGSNGTSTYGTIYKLTPKGNGQWSETTLHTCTGGNDDGPVGVIIDAKGNLYGAMSGAGDQSYGLIFKLSPGAKGKWNEAALYLFSQSDGTAYSNVIFGPTGDLYGTTVAVDMFSKNTAYRLAPESKGNWSYSVIQTFGQSDAPIDPLAFDAAGDLYGVTRQGGTFNQGMAFKLAPQGNGKWSETTLHNFNANGTDGADPNGSLIFDGSGNLYGTTTLGGNLSGCNGQGCGVVFRITP